MSAAVETVMTLDVVIAQLNEQRIASVGQRKEKLIVLGEAAFKFFEDAAGNVVSQERTIRYGDLSNERSEVRRLNQRIAEIDLVLRWLRGFRKEEPR